MTIQQSGNIGVGNSSPNARLDVSGAIVSRIVNNCSSTSFDFSSGNNQYTSANCGSYTLSNMQDGGVYYIIVKGTTSATCSFTHSGLTVRMPTGHGATTATRHTVYTFMRAGADLYVSWQPGY
jgi:hypothetical protein